MTTEAPSPTRLGDTIDIDDRTALVLGQELDVAADRPDVANALLHRVDDTLALVPAVLAVAGWKLRKRDR